MTSHSVQLTGLDSRTRPTHFRVSLDGRRSNATTSPNPPAAPATFARRRRSRPTRPSPTSAPARPAPDLRLRHRRWRGHPRADRRRRSSAARICPAAGQERVPGPAVDARRRRGQLTVDGASPGRRRSMARAASLEFVATFGAAPFQHAGFAVDLNDVARWAASGRQRRPASSTPASRRRAGASRGGSARACIGSPHSYRIEWTATQVRFLHRRDARAHVDEADRRSRCARSSSRLQHRRRRPSSSTGCG